MCCTIDVAYTDKRLAELETKCVSISGYKVLRTDGTSFVSGTGYQYRPGTHKMSKRITREEYDKVTQGFHFYLYLKHAKREARYNSTLVPIRVTIPVNDIIGLQTPGSYDEQGVSHSLFISEKDWLKAGLKLPAPIKAKSTKTKKNS